jgi:hypothetical protein
MKRREGLEEWSRKPIMNDRFKTANSFPLNKTLAKNRTFRFKPVGSNQVGPAFRLQPASAGVVCCPTRFEKQSILKTAGGFLDG